MSWPLNGGDIKTMIQNTIKKTKDRAIQTPPKTGSDLRCSGRVSRIKGQGPSVLNFKNLELPRYN